MSEAARPVARPSPAQRLARLALGEKALAEHPGRPAAWLGLAQALRDLGRAEAARGRLDEACARFPEAEPLHAERAGLLAQLGEDGLALQEAERWQGRPWADRLALRLHCRAGRFEQAGPLEQAVAAAHPSDPHLFECRARRLRSQPAALLALCDEALAREPGGGNALYHRIVALAMLGRGDEARDLLGLDRFLQAAPLAGLVSGFDPEAALPELEREIRSNPTLHSEGPGHATRKGLRTRNFPAVDDRACAELVGHIGAAIEGYAGRLEGDHPFVRGRPERIGLAAWALLLPAAGHQCLHVHPAGWLTGVFYVTAPPGAPRPGRLRVGGLPEWAGIAPPWPVVEIEPTPGTLVLFPSFVPHETEPTGSAADRISVASDAGEPSGFYY